MRTWLNILGIISFAGSFALAAACESDQPMVAEGGGGSVAGPGGTGGGGSREVSTTSTTSSGTGGGKPECDAAPDEDRDRDGFTFLGGDCDDCNAEVNPNAVEVTTPVDAGGNPLPAIDENCDGEIDNIDPPCDVSLALDERDELVAVKAIELCKQSAGENDWGVVSARWVRVDGSSPPVDPPKLANFHLGHGLLEGFGPNVQPMAGARLLALSSGTARQQVDPGYESPEGFDKQYSGAYPEGFPKIPRDCPGILPGPPADPTALEVDIRVPSNAHGFSFNINYNTFDWPEVCNNFNDFFIALLAPPPPDRIDGHLLFDGTGNPMSVSNSLIDVCGCAGGPPCTFGGKTYACSRGTSELLGTGFESHAATSWLITTAPVEPGSQITIRWGAYDSGDHLVDSTGLIDNWRWITEPGVVVSTQPNSLVK
jgi:hypothetical protein